MQSVATHLSLHRTPCSSYGSPRGTASCSYPYHSWCLSFLCTQQTTRPSAPGPSDTCWTPREICVCMTFIFMHHDDVIKWKHFPRYWPFVRRIHWPPVNSPHKGQWRRALMFSLICAWTNGWVNNRGSGDLRRLFIRRRRTYPRHIFSTICYLTQMM